MSKSDASARIDELNRIRRIWADKLDNRMIDSLNRREQELQDIVWQGEPE